MTENERLGEVLRSGDELTIRYVRELRHPPQKVWAALTESEHLHAWMPVDLVGDRVAFGSLKAKFWPEFVDKYGILETELPAEILVWEPPQLLEWRWDTDILRFELQVCPVGTRLIFSTTIDTRQVPGHKTGAGYHLCLRCLEDHLDKGKPDVPLIDQPTEELEGLYLKLFGER